MRSGARAWCSPSAVPVTVPRRRSRSPTSGTSGCSWPTRRCARPARSRRSAHDERCRSSHSDPDRLRGARVRARQVALDGRRRVVPEASSSTGSGRPAPDRRDPVEVLVEQNSRREPDLVPVRHGRMMVSPFTFYRGAARVMAADLGTHAQVGTQRADLRRRAPVQLRSLRRTRSRSRLRPQRLRRNAAGALGVGREAHGGELHDRRASSRVHTKGDRRRHEHLRQELPGGHGRFRGHAHDGRLVLAPECRGTAG